MKERGIYTAAVAIIAIAIISAIAFGMTSSIESEKFTSAADDIVDVKWEMQNASYLASKSAADAIADDIYQRDCLFDEGGIKTRTQDYFTDVLDESISHCTYDNFDMDFPGAGQTRINFDLTCIKQTTNSEMQYKKIIALSKKAVFTDLGAGCMVDIKDLDTEECEVDQLIGAGSDCGN